MLQQYMLQGMLHEMLHRVSAPLSSDPRKNESTNGYGTLGMSYAKKS